MAMTDRAKVAFVYSLLGNLAVIAGAAWLWGPMALGVGGMFMVLLGVFLIDVDGRDRKP
jgi:hypothetical protein